MRSSQAVGKRALSSVGLVCLMGAALANAQERGARVHVTPAVSVLTSCAQLVLGSTENFDGDDSGAEFGGESVGGSGDSGASQTPESSRLTTPEQKAARRSACERDRDEARSELQASYRSHMRTCALQVGSSLGYLKEQWKQFVSEIASLGSGSCATSLSRDFLMMNGVYDRRRDACLLAADKD